MAVAHAALKTTVEEGLAENANEMGKLLIDGLRKFNSPVFKEVRGRGLFIGVEIEGSSHVDGNDFAKKMLPHGIITKATRNNTVRLTPPLVINKSQVEIALENIYKATKDLEHLSEVRGNEKK